MASPAGLVRTALTNALNGTDAEITVDSLTGIVDGDIIVIGSERLRVSHTGTIANPVSVVRGYDGSASQSHAAGVRIYHGEPDKFTALHSNASALFGDSGTFPQYLVPGQRATNGLGDEFLMVEASAQVYSGTVCSVSIDGNFTSAAGATNERGLVGVAVEQIDSTEFGWLQVFGNYSAAQESGNSTAITSAYLAAVASTASTPATMLRGVAGDTTISVQLIYGMFITGVGTSGAAATSVTSITVPVYLMHPYTTGLVDSVDTSNS